MKDLREVETYSGKPSVRRSARPRRTSRLGSGSLERKKPMPGSRMSRSRPIPARRSAAMRSWKNAMIRSIIRLPESGIRAARAVADIECMITTRAGESRSASTEPACVRAVISLIVRTPMLRTRRMTSGLFVSTDTSTPSAMSRSSTGVRRSISISAVTFSESGWDDSAPTSMMSAPSSRSRSACAQAASRSRYTPPSENESRVRLRMPTIFTAPAPWPCRGW